MSDALSDGEIVLRLQKEAPADPCRSWVRSRHYGIVLERSDTVVGEIDIRLGYTLDLVRYGGNIGYGVDEHYRGHHYAGKACKLAKSIARECGMDVLWITCNPDNWASRRTCEWIGATLVEVVDLPSDNDQYLEGQRQKCRYRWVLY